MPVAPPTAYPAGTKSTVGSHEVEISDFIGEGGFAHVYTVRAHPPIPGQDITCSKRVQVPDKAYLNLSRAEVDAMQRLKGASNIVQYFDSHAERMQNNAIASGPPGQYEVFSLMEYCERGGLIDFMNTRSRDQSREHEILKIMYDITLGLAHMHYLTPPSSHRDSKIENVLITGDGEFKLCDFGSVSPVSRPPKTPQEFQILEDDIQHHTTVQYRAPEMVDIARGHPIDEKSDIWALGIFSYKSCYYTTPFERPNQTLDQFQQLILAGAFTVPPRPAYSDRSRNMIRVSSQSDPRMRPNVFQVMQEICAMRHVETPIQDIYSRPAVNPAAPMPQPVPMQAIPLQMQINQGVASRAVPVPQPVYPAYSNAVPQSAASSSSPSVGASSSYVPQGQPVPISQGPQQQPQPQPQQSQPLQTQQQQQPVLGPAQPQPIPQQQRFVPGVQYYRPQQGDLPAPGQVPVPGVSLTSPMPVPLSPERSVSPMSPMEDSAARFPSLEELDRNPPSSSTTRSNTMTASAVNFVPPAGPAAAGPVSISTSAIPNTATAANAQSSSPASASAPKPSIVGKPKPKPKLTSPSSISFDESQPRVMPRSRSNSPTRGSSEEPESSTSVSAEANKLKQISNGISDRSSTVIMDNSAQKSDLSSVDFLRTLRSSTDGAGSHLHLPHHHHHRKPSVTSFHSSARNKEYSRRDSKYDDFDDDDYDEDDDDEDVPVRPNHKFSSAAEHEKFSFDDSRDFDVSRDLDVSPEYEPRRTRQEDYSASDDTDREDNFKGGSKEGFIEPDASERAQLSRHASMKTTANKNAAVTAAASAVNSVKSAVTSKSDVKPPKPVRPAKTVSVEMKKTALNTPSHSLPAKPSSPKPTAKTFGYSRSVPTVKTKSSKPTAATAAPVSSPPFKKTNDDVSSSAGSENPASRIPPKPENKPSVSAPSALPSKAKKPPVAKHLHRVATTPNEHPETSGSSLSKPLDRSNKAKPRPKSANIGETLATITAGESDTFKPSNTIQQRVHMFLNSHDRQHPPRRTARGYGRFTDVPESPTDYSSDRDYDDRPEIIGSYNDINDDEDLEGGAYASEGLVSVDSRHHRSSGEYYRRRSLGDIPPLPSRAAKPKIK